MPLGSRALQVYLGTSPGPTVSARIGRFCEAARALGAEAVPGLVCALLILDQPWDSESGNRLGLLAEGCWAGKGVGGGSLREIEVAYDGPDLAWVAQQLGLGVEELIEAHTGREMRVLCMGFSAGFAFLGPVTPALRLGRRAEPRVRVPGGAVALAGGFSAVYPSETPGGWHLLGSTAARLFDPRQVPPTLLQPGDRVRFRRAGLPASARPAVITPAALGCSDLGLVVVEAGPYTTIQDRPRHLAHLGIPWAGAVDSVSAPAGPCLEVTLGGLAVRARGGPVRLRLHGPGASAQVGPAEIGPGSWFELLPGPTLRITQAIGLRSYLETERALLVESLLGSVSTDTLSGFGGRRLQAGDELGLGAIGVREAPGPDLVPFLDAPVVTLRAIPGPQWRWLTRAGRRALAEGVFTVTPAADRTGLRLDGPRVEMRRAEVFSEPLLEGSVQVLPSGAAVVLLANRQTHGGYPRPLILDSSVHLAAQLRPGRNLRFEVVEQQSDILNAPYGE